MAHARVAAVPFNGTDLFRDILDHYLIEDKDKKKVLPSRRKEGKSCKSFRPFRDTRNPIRSAYSKSFKSRWLAKSKDEPKGSAFARNSQAGKGPKKSA